MSDVVMVFPNLEALSREAVEAFEAACRRIDERAIHVAVSGGSTPKRLFEILAEPSEESSVPWDRLHLYWVDERPVPHDHPDSNYGMAKEVLLDHVPIPSENVHPFPAGDLPPGKVAEAYEATLRETVPVAGGYPRFDLIVLGMGDDGHTASLFPNSPALSETERWAVANPVTKLGVERLTLTFPVLLNAAEAMVLVSGAGKAAAVRAVLEGPDDAETWPAQRLRAMGRRVVWMLDEEAAG